MSQKNHPAANPLPYLFAIVFMITTSCGSLPESAVAVNNVQPELPDPGAVAFEEAAVKPRFGYDCEKDAETCFKDMLNAIVLKNFRYPPEAVRKGMKGMVMLTIGVRPNGEVAVVGVKGPYPVLEQASLGFLQDIPNVYQAKDEQGNPIPVEYNYPIHFEIR